VREAEEGFVCGTGAIRLRVNEGKSDVTSEFLSHVLANPASITWFKFHAIGATMPNLNEAIIRSFSFDLPPIDEQGAIARILGALDDKIELNRQISQTLEATARALFKSWFIDFDPVRAKLKGRSTSLPSHLDDLFPGKLAESEIGDVPSSWSVGTLETFFDAVKGVSYKGSGLSDEGTPLHNLNSIYEGGGYKYEGLKHYNGDHRERHRVVAGDVIVANTEQGHDRLLIGYAAIVPKMFGQKGIASHHIYRLRPKPVSPLTARYLCMLLNSPEMHDIVSGYANGTTVNMLPIVGVQKPQIVVPPSGLVRAFDSLSLSILDRREQSFLESETLVNLRDTLLPKLISGELRIKDAERFVEASV
jgi:type I restriction enzyme S subunit